MAAPEEDRELDDVYAETQDIYEEAMADQMGLHSGKSLEELNVLEDEIQEDVLETLRKRRLDMLKKQAARNKFGRVINISEPEWKPEVTEAEKDVWVVVNLWTAGKQECRLVDQIMEQLAGKFKDVKFVRIEGRNAVRNWPDDNCPAMFVYLGGEIKLTLIGLNALGGPKMSARSLEWVLSKVGAVQTEMTEDPREEEMKQRFNRLDKARKEFEDEADEDWLN